jgi:isoquinoline 1-oxidoreductase subunit beta
MKAMSRTQFTRRDFLLTTAAAGGGIVVSIAMPGVAAAIAPVSEQNSADLGPWLSIAPDDSVLLRVPLPESGNGAMTFAAMAVVEEL